MSINLIRIAVIPGFDNFGCGLKSWQKIDKGFLVHLAGEDTMIYATASKWKTTSSPSMREYYCTIMTGV